jgi:valyl-tRNA synthetase
MKTLETFFPTDVLITGFDIIFFWVARLIMFSLKLTGKIPFKQIYITGLIRDADGQKMSKSKGNVIDPIDLIDGIELEALVEKRTASLMQTHMKEKIAKKTREEFPEGIAAHGTDAVRFTFCALSNNNRNIRFDLQRLTGYRNFCNKLWNASRFVMMNVEGKENGSQGIELSLADQWILSRLQNTINKVHGYFEQYRFDYLAQALYEFVWHEYCDWYLELSKVVLNDDNASEAMKQGTRHTLINVLETVLRLAHPIIPFITEAIWQEVAPLAGIKGNTIMTQAYPQADNNLLNEQAEAAIDWLQQVTLGVRNIRGEMNIAPGKRLQAFLVKGNEADREYFANAKDLLLNIARLDSAQWQEEAALPASATATIKNLEVHIPLAGLIDVEAEAARLDKEIEKLDKDIAKMKGKLGNESFVSKAPEAVVEKEKARLAQAESTRAQLQEQKAKLAQL